MNMVFMNIASEDHPHFRAMAINDFVVVDIDKKLTYINYTDPRIPC